MKYTMRLKLAYVNFNNKHVHSQHVKCFNINEHIYTLKSKKDKKMTASVVISILLKLKPFQIKLSVDYGLKLSLSYKNICTSLTSFLKNCFNAHPRGDDMISIRTQCLLQLQNLRTLSAA